MDFNRLAEFAAVARWGNMRQAAEELGISAATLSARLRGFERQIGAKLFEKCGNGVMLTTAGELLLPDAAELINDYRQLRREINAAKTHYYHSLRIAITGSNLPLHLGPFMDRLNKNYPNIRIELMDDSKYGIVDGLRSGEVDIYFAPVMDDFDAQGLAMVKVSASIQFVAMPRSHRLADRAMVSMRELDREQFILYPKTAESAIRDFQLRNLKDVGIHYSLYDSASSVTFYKLLIPVGKGLLLRPTSMIDLPPGSVCIPVTDLPHPAATAFFYDKSTQNPEVLAFVSDFPAFVKEAANEHKPAL